MNKQELIDQYKNYENVLDDIGARVACKHFLKDLEQLDEPKPVEVPQFVADWIEEARKACKDVGDFFEFNFTNDEVEKWFMQERPFDLAARAWLDGYEVKKEKRYLVKVKGVSGDCCYLNKELLSKEYFLASKTEANGYRVKHTRKQLEDAGFGWVFDCEGVEVEEVE